MVHHDFLTAHDIECQNISMSNTDGGGSYTANDIYSLYGVLYVAAVKFRVNQAGKSSTKAFEVGTATPYIAIATVTTTERDAIASPFEGMLVYNDTTHQLEDYNGSGWGAV